MAIYLRLEIPQALFSLNCDPLNICVIHLMPVNQTIKNSVNGSVVSLLLFCRFKSVSVTLWYTFQKSADVIRITV